MLGSFQHPLYKNHDKVDEIHTLIMFGGDDVLP